MPSTEKTPAFVLVPKLPPRISAPGAPVVAAPAKHCSSSLKPPQLPLQPVDRGPQSATHSWMFPTSSNAPPSETPPPAAPATATAPLEVLHGALSEVPSVAACHSALVGSRFPAFRDAATAWNQV